MERDLIIKALECCASDGCEFCPYSRMPTLANCVLFTMGNALALIKELTQAHKMLSESYDHLEKAKDELLLERAKLTEENEWLRTKTDILDEEYTKTAKRFYKEGVKDMKERIEALFPSDKKFTTISLFTLVQTAKELKGE